MGLYIKVFSINATNLNYGVGIILSAAVLYDFLFRSSISFNMLFLEEIWSRNLTNLFVSPIKLSEIIISLTIAALARALIGVVPAVLIISPLFDFSIFELGFWNISNANQSLHFWDFTRSHGLIWIIKIRSSI